MRKKMDKENFNLFSKKKQHELWTNFNFIMILERVVSEN